MSSPRKTASADLPWGRRFSGLPRIAGFTLIEVLVTAVIISILASLALPLVELNSRRYQENELRASLREIREALDSYKKSVDEGHILRAPGRSGYPPSLEVLVDGVIDARSPSGEKIYFLRRIPRDPFAEDASLTAAASWGKRSYASAPSAPEEGADVYDVYSRSPQVGINGIPYREW